MPAAGSSAFADPKCFCFFISYQVDLTAASAAARTDTKRKQYHGKGARREGAFGNTTERFAQLSKHVYMPD